MIENFKSFDADTIAAPEVKPAGDAIDALADLACNFVDSTQKTEANPDLTDKGKEKIISKARADFLAESGKLRGQVAAAMENQGQQVAAVVQAAREADKPAEMPSDAPLEAALAMERLKNMPPADFLATYQAAVDGQDYITRRAAESVAGAVLKPRTAELGHFNHLRDKVQNPDTPDVRAAKNKLDTLQKFQVLAGYITDQTVNKGEVPFRRAAM